MLTEQANLSITLVTSNNVHSFNISRELLSESKHCFGVPKTYVGFHCFLFMAIYVSLLKMSSFLIFYF